MVRDIRDVSLIAEADERVGGPDVDSRNAMAVALKCASRVHAGNAARPKEAVELAERIREVAPRHSSLIGTLLRPDTGCARTRAELGGEGPFRWERRMPAGDASQQSLRDSGIRQRQEGPLKW
jgi:hypothetical protein